MPRTVVAAVAPLVLAATLAGCSGTRAPTAANFRRALEPVARQAYCHSLSIDGVGPPVSADAAWPLTVAAAQPDYGYGRSDLLRLEAAARDGLLTRRAGRAGGSGTVTFAPTDRGRPYAQSLAGRTMGGADRVFPALCDAVGEVAEVVRWTEPADLMGRRASRVTYRYQGVRPRPGLDAGTAAEVARPREATLALELTGDGWRVMK